MACKVGNIIGFIVGELLRGGEDGYAEGGSKVMKVGAADGAVGAAEGGSKVMEVGAADGAVGAAERKEFGEPERSHARKHWKPVNPLAISAPLPPAKPANPDAGPPSAQTGSNPVS
eukprot:gene26210-7227_t